MSREAECEMADFPGRELKRCSLCLRDYNQPTYDYQKPALSERPRPGFYPDLFAPGREDGPRLVISLLLSMPEQLHKWTI
jgi:hypothetical protein